MTPAPIRVIDRYTFKTDLIGPGNRFFISIREADEKGEPTLRPELEGERLDFFFYDIVTGRGKATRHDIRRLNTFAKLYAVAARLAPDENGLVVHCFAGRSRSAAVALLPLIYYYEGDLKAAATRLFEVNNYCDPNTLVVHLIEEHVGLPGGSLHEAVFNGSSRVAHGDDYSLF